MLNNLILVGRTVEDVTVVTLDSGAKRAVLTLAVQRPFKNLNDEYDTDFIPVLLWEGIAETAAEYCTKGSIVGIKCRLQTRTSEIESKKIKNIEVFGEWLTFISLKKDNQS